MFCSRKLTIFLFALSLSFPISAKPKRTLKKKAPIKKVVIQEQQPPTPYRLLVSNSFGFSHLGGLGFFSGVGIGFVLSDQSKFALGADCNLALYSQGSLFSPLAALWYHFSGNSHLESGANIGVLVGPAFSGGGLGLNNTSWVLGLEGAWNKTISDLVLLRVLLRPGIVDSRFFIQGGIGFVFRFA